jgi:predicted unusual protein kinase regulating ubiquinone biosynthesis (AarF/ABC1/UbiB family)
MSEQIFFLFNFIGILLVESLKFCIFNNYNQFIKGITYKLSRINILFIKIFQAFALNNNLINNELNNELLKFTDNVPWNNFEVNLNTIFYLEDKYDLLFDDYIPINSGMISIVFKVTNKKTNKPLIVKFKRTNIESRLEIDFKNLLFLIYIISFIPIIKKLDLYSILINNTNAMRQQCDFNNEVNNMKLMYNNFKNIKYIKIPEVYSEVTNNNPNVIMMEYINGKTIYQIEEEDYTNYAKLVIKFGFISLLLHGLSHGDLHSGNILFIKDENCVKNKYKLGILDFGILYDIDTIFKNKLLNIACDVFNDTPKEISIKLLESGIIEPLEIIKSLPKEHYNNIIKILSSIIEETLLEVNQSKIYDFLTSLDNYIKNNYLTGLGLKPSSNFVKLQLAIAMTHGVVMLLSKDKEYIYLANNVLSELLNMGFK